MIEVQTILVPVDGSDHAFKAIEVAARFRTDADTEVLLLNVIGRDQFPEAVRRFARVEHIDDPPHWQYEQLVAAGILKAGLRLAREKGIQIAQTTMRHGDPARAILDTAADRGVDLIVMGNLGLGSFRGLAFGSVSQKVTQSARCPVIVVKG